MQLDTSIQSSEECAGGRVEGVSAPDQQPATTDGYCSPQSLPLATTGGSRVMVNPDTDPPEISRQVVDAVGYRAAQFLDQEVMDPDLCRIALRAILAAWVAEIPDQFLFLGVDRDHRLLFRQSCGHLGVDVAKLRIPVGVAIALLGLAVSLQAVARMVEQFG